MRWIALTAAAAAALGLLSVAAQSPADAPSTAPPTHRRAARIALHGQKVVLRTVLEGSAACHGQPTDNGASADLHAPGTTTESLRWRRFGATQSVALYSSLAKTGTYRIEGVDVEVYDSSERQVAWSWRTTSTVVKWAARADHVTASSGRVTGRTVHSSKYGLVASRTLVHVQRRGVGTTVWRDLGSVRPDTRGRISYATATTSAYDYRLVFHATPAVWGAVSTTVRG